MMSRGIKESRLSRYDDRTIELECADRLNQ